MPLPTERTSNSKLGHVHQERSYLACVEALKDFAHPRPRRSLFVFNLLLGFVWPSCYDVLALFLKFVFTFETVSSSPTRKIIWWDFFHRSY